MSRLSLALAVLFLGAVSAAAQDGPDLSGPGISLDLARHRAATLSDLRYRLAFRVPSARDSAIHGELALGLTRRGDGPLILDFAAPGRVLSVRVDGAPAPFRHEHGHLVLPAQAVAAGRREIAMTFIAGDGPLNRREDFLYTLFVPDRAHEAFPGFDQPDLKARFTLELTVPAGWTVVANGAERSRSEVDGVAVHRFAETEPIPTYLFSFATGRFDVEEAVRDGRPLRLLHRETDRAKLERNRETIFDLHAAALRWLEEYTGIPYPFGKFDFVAIPSFQYGGMEHPGAILYRAEGLFLDETATRNEELGRASVIAHETAHMWFGDLVTMTWFDDVWMKEVFANFMAAKIVNPSFPDIDHELRFLLAHYPAAYSVDRTAGANPIRQPLENLVDAGSLYGAIIYQKAPIVMRQLERLTGEAPMRRALRGYLARHALGNAGWPALVEALDAVTPLDVRAWSRVWIEEAGRPTIVVERAGDSVALRQHDPRGRGVLWPQRTMVRALADREWLDRPVTLDAAVTRVALPSGAGHGVQIVLPNGDGLGYGLFLLDENTTASLLRDLPLLPDALGRAAGWIALWEMMLEGRVAPAPMLELALALSTPDEDELLAQEALGDLSALFWRYSSPRERARNAARIEAILWDRLEAAGSPSRKAAFLNAWRSMATTPPAVDRMRRLWSGDLEVEGLHLSERDLTTLALQLAIRDPAGADATLDTQRIRIENPDRAARFDFIRPAASPDAAVRDAFFASLARPENRSREEWVAAALGYLHHPLRAESSLRYIRPSLDLLEEVAATGDIFFPTRWLAATLGGHATPVAAAIVRGFIDQRPDYPPRLMGKLLQEADPLFRAARISEPPEPPRR
ncbi:MAG TPA: M1 family aminopeptidase [Longimicrobiales bacterium]|nr:M1 family aminopeptidase [Longimicrobiales bacterium]